MKLGGEGNSRFAAAAGNVSSKRRKKKSKRQRQSVHVAAMIDNDEPFSIPAESSNSSPREIPNSNPMGERKKTRGPTRLLVMSVGKKDLKEIEWNEYGQPIGNKSKRFSSILGVIAREWVAINISTWENVDDSTKDTMWSLLLQKYVIDISHKAFLLRMMGKLWRNWKSGLSIKIRKVVEKGSNVSQRIAMLKPSEVEQNEWDEFVKVRLSNEWTEKSEKMRKVRACLSHPHTSSRKGYARLAQELKEAKGVESIPRVQLWIEGHKRKNGLFINQAVDESIRKMEEYPELLGTSSIKEDALTKIFGPERPGYVRGLGFGVTPSKIDAQTQNCGWRKELENVIKKLVERQKCLEDIILELRPSVSNSKNDSGNMNSSTSMAPSMSDSANVVDKNNKRNGYCDLLNWTATGEVVAKAEVASKDPTSHVHHAMLGPDCYKVWIRQVLVHDVQLYRCSSEHFTLDDALGSTVAWPHRYIKFD